MDFADDILQPMPVDLMADYRAECAKQLPYALRGHHFLLLQERWIRNITKTENQQLAQNMSNRCKFVFYIHRSGKVENCTFVAIAETATHHDEYTILPFTLEPDCNELRECMHQTKRINWHFSPYISSIHSEHVGSVLDFINTNGYSLDKEYTDHNLCVFLPVEEAAKFEYEIPDDLYAAPLDETYATTIDGVWTHRSPRSLSLIATHLRMNKISIGLFDRETNEMLGWVFTNYRFAISNLYTVPSVRRRGLAKLLVKMFSRELAKQENLSPIAYIVDTNTASLTLFKSLGFQIFRKSWWLKLKTAH